MVRVSVIQAVSPGPYCSNRSASSTGGVSPTPFGNNSNSNGNDRPQSALSLSHRQAQSPELTIMYNCSSFEDLQQQDQQANEFLASLIMAGGANNNNGTGNNSHSQSQSSTNTNMAMASQNNGSSRYSKTKSGSLPGRYTSTSAGMGATAVLLSPQPYSPSSSSIPPGAYYHNYSARPYSFMPVSAPTATTVTNPHQQRPSPSPIMPVVAPGRGSRKEKESSKKWNPFGGLFRRKDKHPSPSSQKLTPTTTVAAIPIKIQFEASQRPHPAASGGPAIISSGGSDYEAESLSDSRSSDDHKKRSSFLGRKLSGGKKKSKSNPAVVHADLLRVPGGPAPVLHRHPHSNGGQNPRRNQNRYSQPILQSWETTKKIAVVPPTSSSSLLMLNSPSNPHPYAYSDSGSLSLSLEGSSSLTKGSKAAAKEATKARAEARRNSYIQDDSSEEEGHGHDAAGRGGGSGSYHGSHSSLSLRNSGSGGGKKNGYRNGSGALAPAPAPARPALPSADNLGLPFPHQSSTSSPTLYYQQQQHVPMPTPTSPRWEARVVYTKETLEDDGKPVVVKLPKYSARHVGTPQETLSSDVNEEGQIVVTAGLRVPIAMNADRVHFNDNTNERRREPIYANTKTGANSVSPLPLPPKGGFYRPVSCSFLDSYRQQDQPQSLLQYKKEPARLRSPVDSSVYGHAYEFDHVPLSAASVATKLLPPSSPVHSRAANFWKQKEQETLQQEHGQPNGTGTGSSRGVSVSPSPARDRPPIASGQTGAARIRSADTSPLLQPRHPHQHLTVNVNANASNATPSNNGTATAPAAHRSLNSTESISSLSSFTTNETHSPSPSNMYKNNNASMSPRPPSRNALRGKIPAGLQQRSSYRCNRALAGSGSELRSAAGFGIGRLSPTVRSTPLSNGNGNADDAKNNNAAATGSRASSIKSPGRNLEDALNELEDMYKSLQLSDEDLLDRAERRDLPTPHQELRNKDLGYFNFDESPQPQSQHGNGHGHACLNGNGIGNGGNTVAHASALNEGRLQSPIYYYSPSPTAYGHGHGAIGSLESLASGGTGTSGSGELVHFGRRPASRVRAPPLRRAGVPDPVNDDMAKRKYDANTKEPKIVDAREQISQTGSYLVLSPAFSPPVSPIPSSIDPGQQYQNYDPSQSNLLLSQPNDPDLTQDDVTVRNYKRANAIRIIPEPQPKFGIPLGPITKAPNSDYLHATPTERHRPLYRHVKNPDLVKDDIAFRALRKDLNQENNNLSSCQWTPKLFSPLKNFENVFNYNEKLINGADGEDEKAKNKRLRAVRSLSANISSLQTNLMGRSPSPTTGAGTRMSPQQPVNSFYSLAGSGAGKELGNNSEYKFYKTRAGTPGTGGGAGAGAGSYMEPSWVQQIELDQDELRELKRSLSPTRVMPLIRSRDVNPLSATVAQKSAPSQRTAVTRTSSSPAASNSGPPKPRRPWTDLILEGIEKEKEEQERDRERERAEREWEREHERQLLQNGANYEYEYGREYDDEEDVFMDASCQTPRDNSPYYHHHETETPKYRHIEPPKVQELHGQSQQKQNRRGSWAENTGNAGAGTGTATAAQAYMTQLLTGAVGADNKRRSWSDFPSSSSGSHYGSGSGPHPSSTSGLDFNPIAPPRRVKQINLEGFHSSQPKNDNDSGCGMQEGTATVQPQLTSILKQSAMTPKENTMKGERELDSLIHALVKEADTCGAKAEPVLEPKKKRKLEIKARYPIDDDEEFFGGGRTKPSTSSTSSIEPQPPSLTYTIGPDNRHDPITRLIKTINENLVPSLETSIRESEMRMSQTNLAASADESEENPAAESSASEPKASKPKPLPRHKTHGSNVAVADKEDDSSLNASADKQSKEFGKLPSSRTGVIKSPAYSAFTPVTVTQSTLCLGKWPKSATATTTVPSSNAEKSIPAIQITDPDAAAPVASVSATETEKSFLRPKKGSATATSSDDGSKRDSLSDAEGMTLLKKLLSRENSTQLPQNQSAMRTPASEESNYFLSHGGIKKSPSTGTTNTNTSFKAGNWSSANPNLNLATPPFLRKYFKDLPSAVASAGAEAGAQKQQLSPGTRARAIAAPFHVITAPAPVPEQEQETKTKPKDVLALNVAQKANLFMKLEHEQRFNKWRKNSEGQDATVALTPKQKNTTTTGSRFSTQPVTSQEISTAMGIGHGHGQTHTAKPETSIVNPKDGPTNEDVCAGAEEGGKGRKLSKSKDDDLTSISAAEAEKRKSSISILSTNAYAGPTCTVSPENKPAARIEPSCLSIKDRVSLFNRISSIPTATVHPMSTATATAAAPVPVPSASSSRFSKSPTFAQSASASESSPQVVHRRVAKTSVTDNVAQPGQSQPQPRTKSFNPHHVLEHRDEHQDHQQVHTHAHAHVREPHSSRHTKGKSLTVSHSWEPDYASEDGEVSSGGQEVSDIISKSYDNSPMFRKKSWKSQIPQPSLSKEIWRKFEARGQEQSTAAEPNPLAPMNTNLYKRTTSPSFVSHDRVESTSSSVPAPMPTLAHAVAHSSSSNLLPILRVLSSSDDGLDPETAEEYAAKLKIDAASSQAKDPSKKSVRKYLKMRTATTATTTAESFHSQNQSHKQQQQQQQTPEPIYDNVSASINARPSPAPAPEASNTAEPDLQLSVVQREGDLLVMKKHMPTVKRKSSHKASKNPLKALAARLDFRTQD